jgi:hypothetical protein
MISTIAVMIVLWMHVGALIIKKSLVMFPRLIIPSHNTYCCELLSNPPCATRADAITVLDE